MQEHDIVLGPEPTLVIQASVAVLNVVQLSAVPMSLWVHVVIVAVITGLGALLNRAAVTPTAKVKAMLLAGPSATPAA